jgi:flagellar biosynthesis protein FlhB
MAKDDRTEKATPKRRQEARKKGQVARSVDFSGAIVMNVGLVVITALAPTVFGAAAASMRNAFEQVAHSGDVMTGAGLNALLHAVMNTMLVTVGPIAGVCVAAGVAANVAQVGFKPSLSAAKPDFKRLNPASGFKNLFGTRVFFETGKNLAKVAVVGAIVAMTLIPQLTHLGASIGTPPAALGKMMGSSIQGIAQRAAMAYLLIAIIDLIWQRRRHDKQLRMTKQEIKEEFKQHSLPPEVKSALRRRQIQAARARMMAAVPHADVVVTNPTHYAAALVYDGSRPAPILVAKGQGYVALQIRRIAEEHGVAIVPDPPLARALHRTVEIDQMIPEEMYAAVAQVLAFVYRMAGRRKAQAAGAR